jgi:alanine-synthesizing transaminase
MMFSSRLPTDLAPNRLSAALASARAAGRPLIDLTASNPTRAELNYPEALLDSLSDPRGLLYRPEPLGLLAARQAVAADFARRGREVDPDRIALTASTSEAYSLLFKLLCDPGDEVLVPRPSYPLFDHLTRLDAVVAVPYDLEYHVSWSIDFSSVENGLSERTRAVLLVNPNNPTGNFVSEPELEQLAGLCAGRGVALIADEVFADYPLQAPRAPVASLLERRDLLGFTLGGLSKSIGLPQAKLGWIVVSGGEATVRHALHRLELACDTYLSVSTPVQLAAADLLRRGAPVREQIAERIALNYHWLIDRVAGTPSCAILRSDGGWSAVMQVPRLGSEEDLVLTLLCDADVLVHPGYFFDFSSESYLILSLLPAAAAFRDGTSRILRHFDCSIGSP